MQIDLGRQRAEALNLMRSTGLPAGAPPTVPPRGGEAPSIVQAAGAFGLARYATAVVGDASQQELLSTQMHRAAAESDSRIAGFVATAGSAGYRLSNQNFSAAADFAGLSARQMASASYSSGQVGQVASMFGGGIPGFGVAGDRPTSLLGLASSGQLGPDAAAAVRYPALGYQRSIRGMGADLDAAFGGQRVRDAQRYYSPSFSESLAAAQRFQHCVFGPWSREAGELMRIIQDRSPA